MKKILLILFTVFAFASYSQSLDIDNRIYPLTTYTMDGDTSYVFATTPEYYFSAQFVWASLDATDGSVKVEISNDGVNYDDYPNTDSLLFNSAGGSGIIRDTYKGTASKYIRFSVDAGTCTSGTLKLYLRLRTKK